MNQKISIVLFLLLTTGLYTAPAATLELITGRTFQCEVLSFRDGVFHVEIDGMQAQVPVEQVKHIDFIDTPQITFPGEPPSAAPVPARPATAPRASPIARYTDIKHREPDAVATPGEIRAGIFRFNEQLIRLNIHWRGPIEQINKDEYKAILYEGTDHMGMVAFFNADALRYVQSIQSSRQPRRTYTLYGVVLAQNKLATEYAPEYRTVFQHQHGIVLLGRRMVRSFDSVEYLW